MDANDHIDLFKRVLNKLIVSTNMTAPVREAYMSDSTSKDVTGSDPDLSPSASQIREHQEMDHSSYELSPRQTDCNDLS